MLDYNITYYINPWSIGRPSSEAKRVSGTEEILWILWHVIVTVLTKTHHPFPSPARWIQISPHFLFKDANSHTHLTLTQDSDRFLSNRTTTPTLMGSFPATTLANTIHTATQGHVKGGKKKGALWRSSCGMWHAASQTCADGASSQPKAVSSETSVQFHYTIGPISEDRSLDKHCPDKITKLTRKSISPTAA